MRRILWLGCLPVVFAAVGCSNRPLVGMMDCFFPSRGGARPPSDPLRPTDRDPLPPVDGFDPSRPPTDGFKRGDLPPLGAPISPDGRRPTEGEVPFTREPAPGAMPLPGGGRQ